MAQIIVGTGIAPATPIAGQVTVYAKAADKKLYYKDETGAETGPIGMGTGTVTTASVVTANGFAGSVANPATTPAITLTTSVTGVLKGVTGGLVAATNADLPVMTATVGGAVPTPPNDATKFLNGQGAFTVPGMAAGSVTQADLAPGVAGNGPAFSAWQSIAQTLLSNTVTIVAVQTKEFDTANAFDAVTNFRFNPQVAGYYMLIAGAGIGTPCWMDAYIYKNGAAYKQIIYSYSASISLGGGSCLVYLNGSTDYAEFWLRIATGQALNASVLQTYFQGFMARAA